MPKRVRVFVYGSDAISLAGVVSQLRGRPGIEVVHDLAVDQADVAVVHADRFDDETLRVCRAIQRNGCPRVVLVVLQIDDTTLLQIAEEGVVAVLRRSEATPEELDQVIHVAAEGGGSLPNDLVGTLIRQVKQVHEDVLTPQGLSFSGLSDRETAVLRLVADGRGTKEIADELCYSERTIKNVIHDVVRRFGLRNRSHAVAYAVRQGLI